MCRAMRLRALILTLPALAITMALSSVPAMAALKAEGGEGSYGKTDDVVVTNFGFGLMIFFVAFVTVMSIGQHLLKKRKDR